VIRDDADDVPAELAELPRLQEVVQAVRRLAHEDRDALLCLRVAQIPLHRVVAPQRVERRGCAGAVEREAAEIPHDAHVEAAALDVAVLVRGEDVAAVPVDEPRDGGNQSRAVGTHDQERRGARLARLGAQSTVRHCSSAGPHEYVVSDSQALPVMAKIVRISVVLWS